MGFVFDFCCELLQMPGLLQQIFCKFFYQTCSVSQSTEKMVKIVDCQIKTPCAY